MIIKAKVPGWLLVAVIAGQFALNTVSNSDEPKCVINVQNIHESTYEREQNKLRAAKLKISTSCNRSQSYTELTGEFIEDVTGSQSTTRRTIENIIGNPNSSTPNYVLIENVLVPCNGKGTGIYRGKAYGFVHLKEGTVIEVNGSSRQSQLLKCRISAE